MLNRDAAAFVILHVVEADGALGGFWGFEIDVAESGSVDQSFNPTDSILAPAKSNT